MESRIVSILFIAIFLFLNGVIPSGSFTGASAYKYRFESKPIRYIGPQGKCKYSNNGSILQADCYNLHLESIPSDLPTDVQILLFGGNRVGKELMNGLLKNFTKLSYVDFGSNRFWEVYPDAFDNQKNLNTLNLTRNGLQEIPKNIFEIPTLKKIYIAKNILIDESLDIIVDSGLEFLQLSRNELTRLPGIKFMSELKHLDVSNNKIQTITADEIAAFCSLEVLDVSGPMLDISGCDCQAVKAWVSKKFIKMFPENLKCQECLTAKEYNLLMNEKTSRIHNQCLEILEIREQINQATRI